MSSGAATAETRSHPPRLYNIHTASQEANSKQPTRSSSRTPKVKPVRVGVKKNPPFITSNSNKKEAMPRTKDINPKRKEKTIAKGMTTTLADLESILPPLQPKNLNIYGVSESLIDLNQGISPLVVKKKAASIALVLGQDRPKAYKYHLTVPIDFKSGTYITKKTNTIYYLSLHVMKNKGELFEGFKVMHWLWHNFNTWGLRDLYLEKKQCIAGHEQSRGDFKKSTELSQAQKEIYTFKKRFLLVIVLNTQAKSVVTSRQVLFEGTMPKLRFFRNPENYWNFNPSPQCFLFFHEIVNIIVIKNKSDHHYCSFLYSMSDLNSIHLSVVFIYFLKPHLCQLFFPSFSAIELVWCLKQLQLTFPFFSLLDHYACLSNISTEIELGQYCMITNIIKVRFFVSKKPFVATYSWAVTDTYSIWHFSVSKSRNWNSANWTLGYEPRARFKKIFKFHFLKMDKFQIKPHSKPGKNRQPRVTKRLMITSQLLQITVHSFNSLHVHC
ncbi:hypothetical protein VP01_131g4 [Puccinia sorghi]|uniref:Uncharacterized protein n=1 Tax=Puccinia sorghi TaxID=27349 RepID=A0A0L6VMQ5_9BASI|nr:hypothetical protein VP01_131g4 [Puccinia sorghi]